MADDKPILPIRLEASATARASLDIKGEIPSSALGRLTHSFADAISPFTERMGLKGDHLRLQRMEVAAQIAERAQQIVEGRGETIKAIPNRVFIPLIEKASYEDNNSGMREWWAALLACTSIDEEFQQPVLSDISSKMTAAEVNYLHCHMMQVSAQWRQEPAESLTEYFERIVQPRAKEIVREHGKRNTFMGDKRDDDYFKNTIGLEMDNFIRGARELGYLIESVKFPGGGFYYFPDLSCRQGPFQKTEREMRDVLIAIGVYARVSHIFTPFTPYIGEFSCYTDALSLTTIGRRLLQVCQAL